MKRILLFLIVFYLKSFSQSYKKADFKKLYHKTLDALRNNDTMAFVNLWQPPDSVHTDCNDFFIQLEHIQHFKLHFVEISTSWKPYLNRITYWRPPAEPDAENPGYDHHTICYELLIERIKNTLYVNNCCIRVTYFRGKLVYDTYSLLSLAKQP